MTPRWDLSQNLWARTLMERAAYPMVAAFCDSCPQAFAVPLVGDTVSDAPTRLIELEVTHALRDRCDGRLTFTEDRP